MKFYACLLAVLCAFGLSAAESPYARWKNGPPHDENYFPIAVWMQEPKDAPRYQELGINLYVALHKGPTDEQLKELAKHNMPVVCDQNRVGKENLSNPIIVGWMHEDEPDNTLHRGPGPAFTPKETVKHYEKLRSVDSTRPILLNLGEGVAWDDYPGRGTHTRHPEDYPAYLKGSDIASFDIYPVVHNKKAVSGKLEFVAKGVERLNAWAEGERIVWNCIECAHIYNAKVKATPAQVRSEVWMSLISGSHGLIYFVHQFRPEFNGASLLSDPDLMGAVKEINAQIKTLAPVLNSPNDPTGVTVEQNAAKISWMMKHHDGEAWLFAVNLTDKPMQATFAIRDSSTGATLEVLGESRQIGLQHAKFSDDFKPYEPHLYAFKSVR